MIQKMQRALHYFLIFLLFIIPIVWWKRLNANFHSTKMVLFFLAGGIAWLLIPKKLSVIKLPITMVFALVTIFVIQIIKYTYAFSVYDFLFYIPTLCSWGLVIYFFSLDLTLESVIEKTRYIIFSVASVILIISTIELINKRFLNPITSFDLLGTAGNINIFAEFLILTLPFVFEWSRYKEKIPSWIKLLIFSVWIFFILYCRSRSAWIGLFLWGLSRFRFGIRRNEFFSILLAILLFTFTVVIHNDSAGLVEGKESSSSLRYGLYVATLQLIKDNPMGVEPGRFISEIYPFLKNTSLEMSETQFYNHPHSEFLMWGANYGWIFLSVILILTVFILIQVIIWLKDKKNGYLVGSILVLLPQLLFQFPFDNPASQIYVCFIAANYFSLFRVKQEFSIKISFRPILVLLTIMGLYSSFGYLNAAYQQATYPKNENIITACDLYPVHLKACKDKLEYLISQNRYREFIKEFKPQLMKQPMFIDFIKLTPSYFSFQYNNKKTCESLFFYRSLFPEHRAFQKNYFDKCEAFTDPFYFDNPKSFRIRYFDWINHL